MSNVDHEVRLLVELPQPVSSGAPLTETADKTNYSPWALSVPAGPSVLLLGQDGQPCLQKAVPGRLDGKVVVQPCHNRLRQQRLVVLNKTGRPLRVNGQPAPRLAVLKEKDYLQWHSTAAFHVTIFHRPNIGSPSAGLLGKECPVCRVPFSAETKCYVCACGTGMHCEDTPDGLQCAHLRTDCPACRRPIVLEEGYSYLPEFEHD